MRVAVCIYGQMRTFNNPLVINSNKKFIFDKVQPDIFISTWNNIGSSIHYDIPNVNDFILREAIKNDPINCQDIIDIYDPKRVQMMDYNEWYNLLDEISLQRINERDGTSVPSLFQMYQVSLLKRQYELDNNFVYDSVIVMRPDMVFWNYLDDGYLSDSDCVYHQNILPDYYPNIFNNTIFVSNSKISDEICNCFLDVFSYTGYEYTHEVAPMNALKILFNFIASKSIKTKSFNTPIAYPLKESSSVPLIEDFYKCRIDV